MVGGLIVMERLASKQEETDRAAFCAGATVAAVGGCTQWGKCQVMLSDGREWEMKLPVVGGKCR